jgi:arginyl-tRNA synthetase
MELKKKISEDLRSAIAELFDVEADIELTVPEPKFGDFATNVAMKLAGQLQKNPREIAGQLVTALLDRGVRSEIAGPGFINLTVSDQDLWNATSTRSVDIFTGQNFVVEYSCPNYFKELHAGHLYQTIAGDVIARLVERGGATVHRTNFGGDVGLHVAKAMYGIVSHLGGENSIGLDTVATSAMERASYISARYVEGSAAYDQDEKAKTLIESFNKRIYALHQGIDDDSEFARIYFTCRDWSREYFVELYRQLRVDEFEKYYPESSTERRGVEEVSSRIGSVFQESDGAVIFRGEDYGLHTRVFITKEKLPTYEAKDIGLILMEMEEFEFDHRILITGRDQAEYMKVVWKAAEQISPGIEAKMTHLVNGIIKFGDGKKMSSRTGNVTTAMDVLRSVREAVGDSGDPLRDEQIYLGAVKYEFLRHRLGGDIAFDPESSVSLQGNSGPYLQYAAVRAKSILAKSNGNMTAVTNLLPDERLLVRKLTEYQQIIYKATQNFETHLLCNYLYELAGEFNRFYEKNLVVGDVREGVRLAMVHEYVTTLESGLGLLGIDIPERM